MPVEIEPPELAALCDYAERGRVGGWSLRSALVRYAQPEPGRVSRILEHVRRIEFALKPHHDVVEKRGPEVWGALSGAVDGQDDGLDPQVLGMLREMAVLDELGDRLAEWALDPAGPRPDDEVDRVVAEVGARLDALGIPVETREGPPPGVGRGRGGPRRNRG